MRFHRIALFSSFWLLLAAPAFADGTVVVASCPGTSQIYAAGQTNRVPAIDIYGNSCTAAGAGNSGGPATIANGADVAEGNTGDAAWSGTGAGTLVSINKAQYGSLQQILTAMTNGSQQTVLQPSAVAGAGIQPIRTTAASSSLVLKASAGNLYGIELTSGASAGYLMIFDATTAPADGTVTPVYAKAIAANSSIELNWTTPAVFSTGIVAVFSTTGPFTKTASATAFISGMVK